MSTRCKVALDALVVEENAVQPEPYTASVTNSEDNKK